MRRKTSFTLVLVVLSLIAAVPAFADQPANVGGGLGNTAPNFSAGVYADNQTWGTKGTTTLPAPTDNTLQAYDILVSFTNGVGGQLAVAEAGPGNPLYNGGRWNAYSATWTGSPTLLTSYDQVLAEVQAGNLVLTPLYSYFQCPLLPVK
jgi:hypothetical protein